MISIYNNNKKKCDSQFIQLKVEMTICLHWNIFPNISAVMSSVFSVTKLIMPILWNSFGQIGQMGLQNGLKLFQFQFDSFWKFAYTVNHLQQLLIPRAVYIHI